MKAAKSPLSYVALFDRVQEMRELVCREYQHDDLCRKVKKFKKRINTNRISS